MVKKGVRKLSRAKWITVGIISVAVVTFLVLQLPELLRPVERVIPTKTGETAKVASLNISPSGFQPKELRVQVGTKVVFTNASESVVQINSAVHPTHLVHPPLNLGAVEVGRNVSLIFSERGTFSYHNHLIPSQTGTVVVE